MVNDRLARFFMAVVATLIIMALVWTSVRAA